MLPELDNWISEVAEYFMNDDEYEDDPEFIEYLAEISNYELQLQYVEMKGEIKDE